VFKNSLWAADLYIPCAPRTKNINALEHWQTRLATQASQAEARHPKSWGVLPVLANHAPALPAFVFRHGWEYRSYPLCSDEPMLQPRTHAMNRGYGDKLKLAAVY